MYSFINKITKLFARIRFSLVSLTILNNSFLYKSTKFSNNKIKFGNNIIIGPNSRIEGIVSWLGEKYSPKLSIGDNTVIEQNLHLVYSGNLVIGNDVTISSNVFISDVNHVLKNETNAQKNPVSHLCTSIGSYSFIGTGAIILPGARLGKNTIVGAGTIVLPGNYADNTKIVGNPGRVLNNV